MVVKQVFRATGKGVVQSMKLRIDRNSQYAFETFRGETEWLGFELFYNLSLCRILHRHCRVILPHAQGSIHLLHQFGNIEKARVIIA